MSGTLKIRTAQRPNDPSVYGSNNNNNNNNNKIMLYVYWPQNSAIESCSETSLKYDLQQETED